MIFGPNKNTIQYNTVSSTGPSSNFSVAYAQSQLHGMTYLK